MDNIPCTTCKYKNRGPMVDPCFPCLCEHDVFTGKPKQQYDNWVDENTPWEVITKEQEELFKAFEEAIKNSPEFKTLLDNFLNTISTPNENSKTNTSPP